MARKTESLVAGITTRIERMDPKALKLLERNARFMRQETYARLVDNVRRDGRLTSVPFAIREPDGRYLVLSGNHRTMAAIDAGLEERQRSTSRADDRHEHGLQSH